jgi:hypothetical protein
MVGFAPLYPPYIYSLILFEENNMKSVKQQKSTRTKTTNRTPTQKPKKLGMATCTGTRAGIGAGGY